MLDHLAGYFLRLSCQLENPTGEGQDIQLETKDNGEKSECTEGNSSEDQTNEGDLYRISYHTRGYK